MNSEAIPFLLAGALGVLAGARVTFSAEAAARYARTSGKAWPWNRLFGVERMAVAVHRFFGPLSLVAGAGFLVVGIARWIGG